VIRNRELDLPKMMSEDLWPEDVSISGLAVADWHELMLPQHITCPASVRTNTMCYKLFDRGTNTMQYNNSI